MKVDAENRRGILSHYRSYSDLYNRVWSNLETVSERFSIAGQEEKKAYLKLSYVNSVISVRTRVPTHERAMRRLMAGEEFESAMQGVNDRSTKIRWMEKTLDDGEVWDEIVSALENDAVDLAHEIALDRLGYVGPVKAPFLLANLGYTEKMCVDANVVRALGLEESPTTQSVEQYEELCNEIYAAFPSLREEMDPYHLQWVLFDWWRYAGVSEAKDIQVRAEPVTRHEPWFEAALSDTSSIQNTVETIP